MFICYLRRICPEPTKPAATKPAACERRNCPQPTKPAAATKPAACDRRNFPEPTKPAVLFLLFKLLDPTPLSVSV